MDQLVNQEESVINMVENMLQEASFKGASDIHIEPYNLNYRIRYRIDGLLCSVKQISFSFGVKVLGRIKILANLDIAERRLPQDGSYYFKGLKGANVECRISTCPTLEGEKVMLRLLTKDKALHSLGMNSTQHMQFLAALNKPNGLILVTGPTGSGKSTTLYHALNYLNTHLVNICTAEDPVEIRLTGINQVNIQPKIGLTFANLLRTFLRQDPDIIMIGEIRDRETAEIALKASQTGHLVLSTLHSNNCVASFARLKNIGLKLSDLAGCLNLIIAQRLVRELCECKNKNAANDYIPLGCSKCKNGYNGRFAIFEMLPLTDELINFLEKAPSLSQIEQFTATMGLETLAQIALNKINLGQTTLEEVKRVVSL